MPEIKITQRGSFDNIKRYMDRVKNSDVKYIFNRYGSEGVAALQNATPIDSSLTANSWYYEIIEKPGVVSLRWCNRNVVDGIPVVILLEYGHGTRSGSYVQGYDFIMPAITPIIERINAEINREVS
jgi:hypothetical protein